MTKYQAIKEHIFSVNDFDYVGICPSSALEGEPEGHRPSDLLPNAKSIIVYARRLIDGSVQSKFRHIEDKVPLAIGSYSAHSFVLSINHLCMKETYDLAQYLEKDFNCFAMPVTNNVIQAVQPENDDYLPFFIDRYMAGLPIDIYKAAVAAGIGEMTWNHRVATPDNGPRIYICAIITDLEFEQYDAPYNGPKLCDPEKCHICSDACPSHSLDAAKGEDVEICGTTYKVGDINKYGCAASCFGFRKSLNPRTRGEVTVDNPDYDEYKKALLKHLEVPGIQTQDHVPMFHCDRCMIYCPIGNWEEKYRAKGLTKK